MLVYSFIYTGSSTHCHHTFFTSYQKLLLLKLQNNNNMLGIHQCVTKHDYSFTHVGGTFPCITMSCYPSGFHSSEHILEKYALHITVKNISNRNTAFLGI